mmetsp:Transcript_29855/g.53703  ORF Transcript_29855/g.53703 Transcript_29855/m.53703 type:complete len:523 (-) Transcript_29855:806-2374(-)
MLEEHSSRLQILEDVGNQILRIIDSHEVLLVRLLLIIGGAGVVMAKGDLGPRRLNVSVGLPHGLHVGAVVGVVVLLLPLPVAVVGVRVGHTWLRLARAHQFGFDVPSIHCGPDHEVQLLLDEVLDLGVRHLKSSLINNVGHRLVFEPCEHPFPLRSAVGHQAPDEAVGVFERRVPDPPFGFLSVPFTGVRGGPSFLRELGLRQLDILGGLRLFLCCLNELLFDLLDPLLGVPPILLFLLCLVHFILRLLLLVRLARLNLLLQPLPLCKGVFTLLLHVFVLLAPGLNRIIGLLLHEILQLLGFPRLLVCLLLDNLCLVFCDAILQILGVGVHVRSPGPWSLDFILCGFLRNAHVCGDLLADLQLLQKLLLGDTIPHVHGGSLQTLHTISKPKGAQRLTETATRWGQIGDQEDAGPGVHEGVAQQPRQLGVSVGNVLCLHVQAIDDVPQSSQRFVDVLRLLHGLALHAGALNALGTGQVHQTQPGLAEDLLVLPRGGLDALHGIGVRVFLFRLNQIHHEDSVGP